MIGLPSLLVVSAISASALAKAPAEADGHAKCQITNTPVLARATGPDGQEAYLTPGALHIGKQVITRCDGLPGGHPLSLVATHRGLVIGFRDAGAQRYEGGAFSAVEGLPTSPIRALAFGERGDTSTLWIGTGSEGLWVDDGSGVARHPHRVLGARGITALAYRAGVLHVGSDPRGHWKVSAAAGTDTRRERIARLSKQPVGCFASGKRVVVRPPGLACMATGSRPHVTSMVRHKGKLIVATFDKGLQTKRGETFVPIA